MKQEETDRKETGDDATRPRMAFLHPNAKGTGCAARFALVPATPEREGGITVALAAQAGGGTTDFDWDGAARVRLDAAEVAKFVRVLRGCDESIDDGKGLFHLTDSGAAVVVRLEHRYEPCCSYLLEVLAVVADGSRRGRRILLSVVEATVLCEAFAGAMHRICFGG